MDVILGQLDRLVQLQGDLSGLVVGEGAPANIGNLMVKDDPSGSLTLFAIDNGIHLRREDRDAYKTFLKQQFSKPFRGHFLCRNIINSIRSSFTLTSSPFYLESKDTEEYKKVDLFLSNMEEFFKRSIIQGILDTENLIKRSNISDFHLCGEIAEIVCERLLIVKGGI